MALDLVLIFKDMVETQDKAQNQRLAGLDYKFERVRGENLENVFNTQMNALPREQQVAVVDRLVGLGLLPGLVKEYMETFDGTWGSIKYDYHKIAISVLDNIEPQIPIKDVIDLASHTVKHMGFSWNDFYGIMAEIRKILKIS